MMLDAIDNHGQPLTIERLYQWHRWLFPVNEWSVKRLHVGQLRGDAPMLVVSGRVDCIFRPIMNTNSDST
ncbi:hypothetical protein ACK4A3_20680 [Aeromonas veronii]